MTTTAAPLRIGEVAERTGTTPRTVRYYEEIGLLAGSSERAHGKHRSYSEADVERLTQILQLKELLGLSLDDLKQLVEAEDARAELRAEWRRAETADAPTRARILRESLVHLARQLELVRGRKQELERLEDELAKKQRRARDLLRRLDS